MKVFLLPALCLVLGTFVGASIIPQQHTGIQSYRVRGKLLCGDQPASGVRVKLVDDDFGPDPDDDLDSGILMPKAYLSCQGIPPKLTTIDPQLKIYHDCNDGIIPCQRR
uniref:Uncharacterized protein n=1 Tax=Ditylenchus dipsaci TaxID=166011 RepID=A0A915ENV7_9BILA